MQPFTNFLGHPSIIFGGAKNVPLLHGDLEDLPAAVDATAISGPRKRWVFFRKTRNIYVASI